LLMKDYIADEKEANVNMCKYRRIWQYCKQHRIASVVVGHISVVSVLGLLLLGNILGPRILGAFAQAACSSRDHPYIVVRGDNLSRIAFRYGTTWWRLAAYTRIPNPNLIYAAQIVCIPGNGPAPAPARVAAPRPALAPLLGRGNFFPYGQCTWWANQRYHQLHGIFVPWTINSNAWAWSNRARDFHWTVSSTPQSGDIIDLQPWVQGAYGLGHVAVVERVLSNGNVITSNMNWGRNRRRVTYVEFSPGRGVSFIRY
jgi:hypothetical protein